MYRIAPYYDFSNADPPAPIMYPIQPYYDFGALSSPVQSESKKVPTAKIETEKVHAAKEDAKKETVEPRKVNAKICGSSGPELLNAIKGQGDKVRDLKAAKADKALIGEAVKKLLELKEDFQKVTGKKYDPKMLEEVVESPSKEETKVDRTQLLLLIKDQGDKVRELKAAKAKKEDIDGAVKGLLGLKDKFKAITGEKWDPKMTEELDKKPTEATSSPANKLLLEIKVQGEKIRDLKAAKADKGKIEPEVKLLLNLKTKFKNETGQDWKPNLVEEVVKSNNNVKIETESRKESSKTVPILEQRQLDLLERLELLNKTLEKGLCGQAKPHISENTQKTVVMKSTGSSSQKGGDSIVLTVEPTISNGALLIDFHKYISAKKPYTLETFRHNSLANSLESRYLLKAEGHDCNSLRIIWKQNEKHWEGGFGNSEVVKGFESVWEQLWKRLGSDPGSYLPIGAKLKSGSDRKEILKDLESGLAKTPFLTGETVSFADKFVAYCLLSKELDCNVGENYPPNVRAWLNRLANKDSSAEYLKFRFMF